MPSDSVQSEVYRILFVHVPSAIMSELIYLFLAVNGFIYLVWRTKISAIFLNSAISIGLIFTALVLITGSIWGKPMWGTWWVWDARLTSELILFFVYLSIIFLYGAFDDVRKGSKAASILAIIGFVNIPIIHFSVEWWNTLHQGPSVMKFDTPSIATEMLFPLLYTSLGFTFYYITAVLMSARNMIIYRERNSQWVNSI